MKRLVIAIVLVSLLCVAAVAHAAPRTKSSIDLGGGSTSTDSFQLQIGDTVTFDIATPYWYVDGRGPWVMLRCFQGGQQVLFAGQGYWEGPTDFILGPTWDWPSGGATCTADLGHYNKLGGKFSVEASKAFDVSG